MMFGLKMSGRRQQQKYDDGHAEPDAVEHRERFVVAVPGLDEALADLADLGRQPWCARAEPS